MAIKQASRNTPRRAAPAGRRGLSAKLKAERIQATGGPGRRLATNEGLPDADRALPGRAIRDLLPALAGWRAMGGNRALVRRFSFPGPKAAAAFAEFVVALAEAGGSQALVERRGAVAVVSVFTAATGAVTWRDIQLASMLKELPA
jgi:pterin-4a-carbinolamine dehydratase